MDRVIRNVKGSLPDYPQYFHQKSVFEARKLNGTSRAREKTLNQTSDIGDGELDEVQTVIEDLTRNKAFYGFVTDHVARVDKFRTVLR